MLKNIMMKSGIVLGASVLSSVAGYSTGLLVDRYMQPKISKEDLDDPEKKAACLDKFVKTKSKVKTGASIAEALLIGGVSTAGLIAVDSYTVLKTEDNSDDSGAQSSGLISNLL